MHRGQRIPSFVWLFLAYFLVSCGNPISPDCNYDIRTGDGSCDDGCNGVVGFPITVVDSCVEVSSTPVRLACGPQPLFSSSDDDIYTCVAVVIDGESTLYQITTLDRSSLDQTWGSGCNGEIRAALNDDIHENCN